MQTLTEEEYKSLVEKTANSKTLVTKFVENLLYPNKILSVSFNDCPDQYELRGWKIRFETNTGEYTCWFAHDNFNRK